MGLPRSPAHFIQVLGKLADVALRFALEPTWWVVVGGGGGGGGGGVLSPASSPFTLLQFVLFWFP